MDIIVLHLSLMEGVWGAPVAYVVRQLVKVVHISPKYDAYLKIDEELIARAPIIDTKSNIKRIQDGLDRKVISLPCCHECHK